MTTLAVLIVALLFGGMTLYSFGFAAFLFTALPAETAGPVIRRAFPHFYVFVLVCSIAAALLLVGRDAQSSLLLAVVAITTLFARQVLMPAINAATDAGNRARFKVLHGASVLITLGHIAAAGVVLAKLTAA